MTNSDNTMFSTAPLNATHPPVPSSISSIYTPSGRVVQTCITYLCAAVLGTLILTRFEHHYKQPQFTRVFALALYWLTLAFVVAVNVEIDVIRDGLAACFATYDLTLAFLAFLKVATLFILVIRTRPLSTTPHWRDPLFLGVCFLLLSGFGSTYYRAFASSNLPHLQADGQCILGFRLREALLLLGFDIAWNLVLTVLFLWHLRRHTRNTAAQIEGFFPSWAAFRAVRPLGRVDPRFYTIEKQPEYLAAKAFVAMIILTLSTTINLLIMILRHGREEIWLFVSTCVLDVTCSCVVTYWLTAKGLHRTSHRLDSIELS